MTIEKRKASLIKLENSVKKDIIKINNHIIKLNKEINDIHNKLLLKKRQFIKAFEEKEFLQNYSKKIAEQILSG